MYIYSCDETFSFFRNRKTMLFLIRPADWCMLDKVVHLVFIFVVEGWYADNHLIE